MKYLTRPPAHEANHTISLTQHAATQMRRSCNNKACYKTTSADTSANQQKKEQVPSEQQRKHSRGHASQDKAPKCWSQQPKVHHKHDAPQQDQLTANFSKFGVQEFCYFESLNLGYLLMYKLLLFSLSLFARKTLGGG